MGQPALRLVPSGPRSGEASKEASGLDDAELVRAAARGQRSAFEALYRRHAKFAFSLVVRLQGTTSDVEDLVHDAFLRAHAELANLRDPAAFRGWLGSILVSQVRMRLRRARWLRALGLGVSDPVEIEGIASEAASPEVRAELAQIYALLRVMPADERIAWTLRHVERHQLEEVAEMTSVSLATAKRRIVRAQQFMHEHFVSPQAEGHGGE